MELHIWTDLNLKLRILNYLSDSIAKAFRIQRIILLYFRYVLKIHPMNGTIKHAVLFLKEISIICRLASLN